MSYTDDMRSGKQRKAGSEAPSIKVFTNTGETCIIGMIAQNVQLLVSVYTLEEQKDLLSKLEESFCEQKKLNLYVVTKESFNSIESFLNDNSFEKINILQDNSGDFGKKLGVTLDSIHLANGAFVIDKEGKFTYVSYFTNTNDEKIEEIIEKTNETINFKPKGHAHENWMSA